MMAMLASAEPIFDKEVNEDSIEISSNDETLHEDLDLPEIQKSRLTRFRQILMATLAVLPSPLLTFYGNNNSFTQDRQDFGSTTYLLGLRGMASFFVFVEHFSMRSHDGLIRQYTYPTLMQLPGIRLIYSGPAWVKMFFILSGFALSVRPIEIIYEKDWERLQHTMTSAFFRRGFRIFIPPIVASLMVLIGVRFRLYEPSNEFVASLGLGYPIYKDNLSEQLFDLVEYLLARVIYPWGWLRPLSNITQSVYATTFWTIPREYYSSLQVFALLIALSRVKPFVRIFTLSNLILYSGWANRGDLACFLVGMLFAEFHIRKKLSGTQSQLCTDNRSLTSRIVSTVTWTIVLALGIWMASIPIAQGNYGSSTPGYRMISKLIPLNDNVISIGMAIVLLGIYKLPFLQLFFSTSFMCYLGDISYSLYLIHWPILAAGGWNLVPMMQKVAAGHSEAGFLLALAIMTPLMFWASDLFWRLVDSSSIRFAKRLEGQLFC